jgi:hypothetical protein
VFAAEYLASAQQSDSCISKGKERPRGPTLLPHVGQLTGVQQAGLQPVMMYLPEGEDQEDEDQEECQAAELAEIEGFVVWVHQTAPCTVPGLMPQRAVRHSPQRSAPPARALPSPFSHREYCTLRRAFSLAPRPWN